jgi:four helix bundle protein
MASSFKELIAWQKAMDMAQSVYGLTAKWPTQERYGLCSQTQRAAVSVPANIAEGHERRTRKEYLRFLAIASGSLAELETHLLLAERLDYANAMETDEVVRQVQEVGRIVRGIERSLAAS